MLTIITTGDDTFLLEYLSRTSHAGGETHTVERQWPGITEQLRFAEAMASTYAVPGMDHTIYTNAEAVFLRVQKMIRRGKIATDQVRVEYVNADPCDENSKDLVRHHIRIDTDGDFVDPWPGGFFGWRFGEI